MSPPPPTKSIHTGRNRRLLALAGLLALAPYIYLLTVLCFRRWMYGVLADDDLINYHVFVTKGFFASPAQAFFKNYDSQFRPVYALAMEGLFSSFGSDGRKIILVLTGFNVACGLIVAALAYRLSGRNALAAFLAATMTATSRFLLYQVTQATGVLEAVGYLLFLVFLWALLELNGPQAPTGRRAAALAAVAIAAEWLAVFDHERYLAAVPWVVAMLWLAPGLGRPQRLLAASVAAGALVANIAVKTLGFRQRMMVGTGGSTIGIDPAGEAHRASQVVLSLFGFNHGPAYIAGQDLATHPFNALGAVALAFTLLILLIAVIGTRAAWSGDQRPAGRLGRYAVPLALAALAGLLVVPPIMTIRMEQRWLVEPFTLIALGLAWCLGQMKARVRALGVAAFAVVVVASLTVDAGLRAGLSGIYWVSGGEIAWKLKTQVLDKAPAGRAIVIAETSVCDWSLDHGFFFEVYDHPGQQGSCVPATQGLDPAVERMNPRPRIYFAAAGQPVADITAQTYANAQDSGDTARLDLIKLFDQGRINNDGHADTPTGKGALVYDVQVGPQARKSLTVVSGFTYRFDHLAVHPGDRLEFEPTMVFSTIDPAKAVVTVTPAGGAPVTVYSALLDKRPKYGPVWPKTVSIPLDRYGQDVSITFGAETPPGLNNSGHWIAFTRPRIVAAGRA